MNNFVALTLFLVFIMSCADQPEQPSDQKNDAPETPYSPQDERRRDETPEREDPYAAKEKQKRLRLQQRRAELEGELQTLKTHKEAFEWSEQYKHFVRWDVGSPVAKDVQEELIAGPQPIRDLVEQLKKLRANADFPKTNREWTKVFTAMAHPYKEIFADFLISYRPGGGPDTVWDYDQIAKLALDKAQEIEDILGNPYTKKTTDYKTLKEEIETINREKKPMSIRYGKVDARIKAIDAALANKFISDFELDSLLRPIE